MVKTSVFDACIQIEQQVPDSPAIRNILEFVRGTEGRESSVNYNFHTYKFFDDGRASRWGWLSFI